MSELEPNVKFQHNDDEPHLNVILAHSTLEGRDIFIFLLHFHSDFVYFCIICKLFGTFFYCSSTFYN
jgi:hypothetical protein